MRHNSFIIMFALAGILSSCVNDQFSNLETDDNLLTIRASVDPSTKTSVVNGGTKVYWDEEDQIKVFNGSFSGKFTTTNTELTDIAEFAGCLPYEEGDHLVALYPYSEEAEYDGNYIIATLPTNQIGRTGTFAENANLAVATSNGLDMLFYNVCSGLRFTVTREGIKSITIEGLNGEVLSGKVKIGLNNGIPEVQRYIEGIRKVNLVAPDNTTFEMGEFYYLSVFPGSLSKGFKMTFYTDEDLQGVVTSTKALNFKRSVIASKSELDTYVSEWTTIVDSEEDLAVSTLEVEIPSNTNPDFLSGIVVSNPYGEYPLEYYQGAGLLTKSGPLNNGLIGNYDFYSNNPIMFTNIVRDKNGEPILACVKVPGLSEVIDATNIAITQLMSNDLLITTDVEDYKRTVAAIKSTDAWHHYLDEIIAERDQAFEEGRVPDFTQISKTPVLNEMFKGIKQDWEIPKDGLAISKVSGYSSSITFTLTNNIKRIVHVYGRAVRLTSNKSAIKNETELVKTYGNILQDLLSGRRDKYGILGQLYTDGEIEQLAAFVDNNISDKWALEFPMPNVIEPKGISTYTQLKRLIKWEDVAPYEKSMTITYYSDYADKYFVDVYGVGKGMFSAFWESSKIVGENGFKSLLENPESLRILAVTVHTAYETIVKPALKLATGSRNTVNASSDFNPFDMEATNFPTLSLIFSLIKNCPVSKLSDITNEIYEEKYGKALETTAKYIVNELLGKNSDKYWPILQTLYLKATGFQNSIWDLSDFMSAAKAYFKQVGIVESLFDLGYSIGNAFVANHKTSFIIDSSQTSTVLVRTPSNLNDLYNTNLHISWVAYLTQSFGNVKYDVKFVVDDGKGRVVSREYKDISGYSLDVDLSEYPDILSSKEAKFNIIAHDPTYGNVRAESGWFDLLGFYNKIDDVPGTNL